MPSEIFSQGDTGTIELALTAGLPPATTSTTTLPGSPTTTTTLPPGLAPETTIDAGPKAKSRKRRATFAFSASVPGAIFACRLDAKPFVPCTSPTTMKVKLGKHVFQVQATNAGYMDPSPAEWRFKRRR